jgi:hypothetical protein
MANVTLSADSNHDDLTARTAGNWIATTSDYNLTIDSIPTQTPMGLLGDLRATSGKVIIDARNVKEIAYSGGSVDNVLPAISSIITDSGGATAKVIKLNSGDQQSGVMTVTVQSGTFAASNTISLGGTTPVTVDSVDVGFMYVFDEGQEWNANALGAWEFYGSPDRYTIGTGDGLDNQTATLPIALAVVAGIWVETGNGTNVYEKWARISESSDALTNYGNGELGNVFRHVHGSSTITFGTATNGNVPASGARIKIPNLFFGTASLATPEVELDVTTAAAPNDLLRFDSANGAPVTIEHCGFSATYNTWSGFSEIDILGCTFLLNGWVAQSTVGTVKLHNCVYAKSDDANNTDHFDFTDNTSHDIDDVLVYASGTAPVSFSNCINGTLNNIKLIAANSSGNRRFSFSNSSNFTVTNCKIINCQFYLTSGSSNISMTGTQTSASRDGVTAWGSSPFVLQLGAANCLIEGWSNIPGGNFYDGDLIVFSDAVNCTARNIGDINSPIDGQGLIDQIVNFNGITKGSKAQRLFITNTSGTPFAFSNTCSNNIVENCGLDYAEKTECDGVENYTKGQHVAAGPLNGNDGVEIDYALSKGNHFQDVFTSATTGRVHWIFTPPTANTQQYVVENFNGNSRWRNDGDLQFNLVGDYVEIESPYWIKGHTGFVNTPYVINGTANAQTDVDVEYAVDTGTGYGAYKAATGANLSAETISPEGFKIKCKITVNTQNYILVNGLFFETTSTIPDQEANFYPLDPDEVIVEDGETYFADAKTQFLVDTDLVTSFTISGFIPTQIEHIGSGTTTVLGTDGAKLIGTTIVATGGTLSTGDGLTPSVNWVESTEGSDRVVRLTNGTTEVDLSGLRGLDYIDYSTSGTFQTYTVAANTRIDVEGDLQIDPAIEKIVFEKDASTATTECPLTVTNSGILRVGKFQNINGVDVFSQGSAIEFIGAATNFYAYYMLFVNGTGSFIWNGGTIRSFGTIRFDQNCTLTVNEGTLLNLHATQSIQLRLTPTDIPGGANMNIYSMTFDGLTAVARFFTTYAYNTASFTFKRGQFQSYNAPYPEVTLLDLDASENVNSSDIRGETNDETITEDIIVQNASRSLNYECDATRNLYCKVQRQLAVTPTDLDNVAVSVFSYYGVDIDNGNREVGPMNATDASQDDTADKTYSGIDQTTPIADNMLVEIGLRNEVGTDVLKKDDRTNSGAIPLNVIAYDRTITQWNPSLYGTGTLTENLPMTPDLLITESVRATVNAYTDIDTAEKFYDRAKSYLCFNYAGESNTIVSRNGSTILAGSYDVVIDATAGANFNVSGNTITIKAATFTGGISTTGTVTVRNGALLLGGTF